MNTRYRLKTLLISENKVACPKCSSGLYLPDRRQSVKCHNCNSTVTNNIDYIDVKTHDFSTAIITNLLFFSWVLWILINKEASVIEYFIFAVFALVFFIAFATEYMQ